MIITRTPYRLSFFGGGTDYAPWFSKEGGFLVGCSFQRYCYIITRYLPPFFEHKFRVVYSKTELIDHVEDIQHPAIRGCLSYLNFHDGVEVQHHGDLPARSGLGSSSSFTVGLLLSLYALKHTMPTKRELADEAVHVEQNVLKENVGIQDQILAAFGGIQRIQIETNGQYEVHPIILPPDYLESLESHIMLGFTGSTRNSTDVAQGHIQAIEKGTTSLSEMMDIARQGYDRFRTQADFSEIGNLMDQNWKLKKGNAKGVSSNAFDELYETGKRKGAYGGKMLGAGGGGFFMFLAPPHKQAAIKEALPNVKVWVPFRLDHTGSQVIFHSDER